jgi:hypothetical protein
VSGDGAWHPARGNAPELDQRSLDLLEFERTWWQERGQKERAIRERFGISSARYHQLLHRLIDRPEALAYDPMLVRRLRRLRETRRRKRLARRLGSDG